MAKRRIVCHAYVATVSVTSRCVDLITFCRAAFHYCACGAPGGGAVIGYRARHRKSVRVVAGGGRYAIRIHYPAIAHECRRLGRQITGSAMCIGSMMHGHDGGEPPKQIPIAGNVSLDSFLFEIGANFSPQTSKMSGYGKLSGQFSIGKTIIALRAAYAEASGVDLSGEVENLHIRDVTDKL